MNSLCVYCQQILSENEKGVCLSCKNKLIDRELDELENYKQRGIEDLFYVSIKLDDYFQLKYPEELTTSDALLFHKRRVVCLNECIGYIDKSIFLPKTTDEVDAFRKTVEKFYAGELTEQQRDLRVKEFIKGNYIGKANSAEYRAKLILATLMSDREKLDWSWWQYMEIHFVDLYKYVHKDRLLNIIEKHFTDEILYFIDLTDYYK